MEKIEHCFVEKQCTLSTMTTQALTQKMSAIQPPKTFGPQWWREGRKWGDLSTPCRLFPPSEDASDMDSLEFEGLPRRSDYPPPPEPTWQELFHDLHDLVTGTDEENRTEVSFEQVGSLIHALNPPRPRPAPVVYKEPALSEYELWKQKELEENKELLVQVRQTYHENRKKLKELVAKQNEVSNALQKKEDDWNAEQERQKKVYRPRYLAAVAPPSKPVFREEAELEKLMDQLTETRRAMSDHEAKVSSLKRKIEEGEAFMKQSYEHLEILREYRKFDQTLVGDYI